MRRNRLLSLLANNRQRGEFRADAGADGNVIWLYDQIVATEEEAYWCGGAAADTFVKSLLAMSGPVAIRINSPGGDVFGGRAMSQAIRDYPDQVTAHVDGYAASAASLITSAADRVVMAPGSMLMIHKAWTLGWGNSDDFAATAALLIKVDGTIAASYVAAAEKRGVDPADFAALMAAETWMTEEEAIAFGLADEVAAGAKKTATATARARWDLSAYTRAPRPETLADAVKPPEPENQAPAPDPDLQQRRAHARTLLENPA